MTKKIELITDAEWEIMRVVWTKNETTSTEVIEILEEKMAWKPSTVKTLLTRLVTKGYLETRKEGKQFIYYAVVSEQKAIKSAGNELLDKICDRKVGGMLVEMIERKPLSLSDIEALEALLKEKKQTAPEIVPCNCIPGQCRC
ncbi:CopY/TcrY family copper transport repressor [Vagococcus hydrophili]|uniref:CopY/TcrY family copper transport repressor n=1 Tax=Vagococcus hydrophili TaxID=2714947 RepID=A0A6G8AQU6_9ENTE|nr:CopY/TcrY family copper transport repressor [Vagococcus hydrophili]QIL47367.1 CopY/TcrY family copper transport repressor [Vagococcus hydrophili]